MRALDLFCGAGGASMGLHRAGFEVVGVDIDRQPHYPFPFIQADATSPPLDLSGFDLIWASPPCQAFSVAAAPHRNKGIKYPDLIEPVRAMLAASGALTIIENVPGAPVRADVVLDGTMFPGLKVIRKRLFELNYRAPFALGFNVSGLIRRGFSCVAGHGTPSNARIADAWHTSDAKRAAMGIDWMNRDELSQSIPPDYSEFLALAAIEAINA